MGSYIASLSWSWITLAKPSFQPNKSEKRISQMRGKRPGLLTKSQAMGISGHSCKRTSTVLFFSFFAAVQSLSYCLLVRKTKTTSCFEDRLFHWHRTYLERTPKQVECRVPPSVAPSSPAVSIQLLSIDNLIATEFLGQTIDDHQREELLDKG